MKVRIINKIMKEEVINMKQSNDQTNYLIELVGFERLHTVKKYAEYFLQNNREVMDQSIINELEMALKYFDLSYVNEWQNPTEDTVVLQLTRFEVPPLRRLSNETLNNWQRKLDEEGPIAGCSTLDDLELCYYRSQLFIYDHGFTYKHSEVPKYGKHTDEWAVLLKKINTEYIEQSYNYDFDGEIEYQLEEDKYVELIFPDEWHVAFTCTTHMLATYTKRSTPLDIKELIDTALMNTLPIEIKYL